MARKKGSKFTAEQKAKISEACRKRWAEKPRGSFSDEHKAKLSESQRHAWQEKRANQKVPTRTVAHRKAMGEGARRAKAAGRYIGRTMSAEARKKIGDGVRAAAAARKERERQAVLEQKGNRSDVGVPF